MRNPKKIIAALLILFLALSLSEAKPALAASKAKKALKAYSKLLSRKNLKFDDGNELIKTKYVKFATAYINKDAIPDLVIHNVKKNSGSGYVVDGLVYVYKGGKLRKAGEASFHVESKVRYYKKKGIMTSYDWGDAAFGNYLEYKKLTQTRLSSSGLYRGFDFGKGSWLYGKLAKPDDDLDQGIQYTKDEYNEAVKKLTGGKASTKFKWHKNTKRNRKKYLVKSKVGK